MSDFFGDLWKAMTSVRAMTREHYRGLPEARRDVLTWAQEASFAKNGKGRLIFIGNGGSAAIASHMAADWQKAGGYRTLSFNDAPALTALANDTGYDNVFANPVALHATKDDTLFAISSSGQSQNIIKAVEAAKERGAVTVTFTGFDNANQLRMMGDLNFYVPSDDYGIVECAHLALIHSLLNEAIHDAR